ncbi:hypothetical protein BN7_3381 [Wickerhamomyces ciferrii]|uniref:Uncharacterized protein n=1 Tax=Wickerhamomyces ciferrii (strain ATCC 14091 / BCRC 22168 / CBS 111 / JCM 3599 / NBRC 0793 / NRRL Y-1031 F-60-10) TaxID=1206466 RepID=K0KNT2_WICCF|nr:uncharacterized protein BN7_3381 [Wickerhamomyces ciferrii]CCH43827.1 hypothetical protein BN7_3381 [Wickerhamomyces ciferrii]
MSETPQPLSPTNETPTANGSPAPGGGSSSTSKNKKQNSQTGKKVSAEILERRRVGRLKAAETMAKKIKKSGIEKRENPLKFSTFESGNLINQKNYFTDYLKKDDQIFILRDRKQIRLNKVQSKTNNTNTSLKNENTPSVSTPLNEDEDDLDDEEVEAEAEAEVEEIEEDKLGSKTIVLHPGSKNIRIGLGTDVYPKTFPFVLALPKKSTPPIKTPEFNNDDDDEILKENFKNLNKDFKERMRYYKRRILPNSNEVVTNFNKKIKPEIIPEHNDIHKQEYIKPINNDDKSFYIGNDALRIDSDDYRLRYPLINNGKFNESDYNSFEEILGEIQLFIKTILEKEFQISKINQYKVVLVIPDLYDKNYVENFIDSLLKMSFQSVAIIQESLAATYGAGVSSSTVVDIGAKSTKISCVDEGMIIPNSRVNLNYGGDDITRLFYKLLKNSEFPINYDLNNEFDWAELNQLKEKFITFQDANITVQLYNFTKRYANQLSEKYEFKVFDEVILAPMGLFFPKVFNKPIGFHSESSIKRESLDVYNGNSNNPTSTTQKNAFDNNLFANKIDFEILKDLINPDTLDDTKEDDFPTIASLDKIIIQSIANASRYDFTKSKNFYENILIVGGGSKIESLDFILTDRINIWRPKILALLNLPDFLKKIELLSSNFEKEHELSKLQSEEEVQVLQDQLLEIIEKELNEFLSTVNNQVIPIEVLPAPREIDPSILTWKGASVFSRLKLIEELWITHHDWDLLGSRTLQYKVLFNY